MSRKVESDWIPIAVQKTSAVQTDEKFFEQKAAVFGIFFSMDKPSCLNGIELMTKFLAFRTDTHR